MLPLSQTSHSDNGKWDLGDIQMERCQICGALYVRLPSGQRVEKNKKQNSLACANVLNKRFALQKSAGEASHGTEINMIAC